VINAVERFMSRVHPEPMSGCWLWTGGMHRSGYGMLRSGKTHRVSWRLFRGEIPQGLYVLHKCDVRCCVNPDHLFLGSHRDNMKDMSRKGRGRSASGDSHPARRTPGWSQGERNGRARLDDARVIAMRRSHAQGETIASLARRYRVSERTAGQAIHRETWRNVP